MFGVIGSALGIGGGSSNSTVIQQTVEATVSNIANMLYDLKQSSRCSININQIIPINIDTAIGCDITLQNKVRSSCDLNSILNTSIDGNFQKLIQDSIDLTAKNSNKMVQDFLSASFGSIENNTDINVQARIKRLIENNFTTNIMQTCINESNIVQGIPVTIKYLDCTKGGSLNLSNEADIVLISKCIGDNIYNIVSNDTDLLGIQSQIENKNEQTQKGIGDLIKGILDSLGKIGLYIIIGLVVVVLIVIIAFVMLGKSEAGQEAIKNYSSK